jgi:hypothetical protein
MSRWDAAVGELVSLGFSRTSAEAAVARAGMAPPSVVGVEEGALEKEIERRGDELMLSLGFEVVKFSQPRATKQTPGIADRRYYRRPRAGGGAVALWWEAKSEGGKQRPDQRVFQELVEACGEVYVVGGLGILKAWLFTNGVVDGWWENGTPKLPGE